MEFQAYLSQFFKKILPIFSFRLYIDMKMQINMCFFTIIFS
jgi:hypothetical protein